MPPLLDAHSHLHDDWLKSTRQSVIATMVSAGITGCVVNGSNKQDWSEVAELCASFEAPRLLPSFGLHPWDVGNRSAKWQENLLRILDDQPNAFVGEIGLDRWILDRAHPDDPRLVGLRRAPLEEQTNALRWQLALAAERNLPASIHCLDAFGALYDVLRSSPRPARGFLLHAYSGSSELAESFTKFGAYFSFNGAFLEPRKTRLRDVYATLPAERLLVETDAPAMRLPSAFERFVLPETPDGESVNHPANLAATYVALADLRRISVDELAQQVAENFARLFGQI